MRKLGSLMHLEFMSLHPLTIFELWSCWVRASISMWLCFNFSRRFTWNSCRTARKVASCWRSKVSIWSNFSNLAELVDISTVDHSSELAVQMFVGILDFGLNSQHLQIHWLLSMDHFKNAVGGIKWFLCWPLSNHLCEYNYHQDKPLPKLYSYSDSEWICHEIHYERERKYKAKPTGLIDALYDIGRIRHTVILVATTWLVLLGQSARSVWCPKFVLLCIQVTFSKVQCLFAKWQSWVPNSKFAVGFLWIAFVLWNLASHKFVTRIFEFVPAFRVSLRVRVRFEVLTLWLFGFD